MSGELEPTGDIIEPTAVYDPKDWRPYPGEYRATIATPRYLGAADLSMRMRIEMGMSLLDPNSMIGGLSND